MWAASRTSSETWGVFIRDRCSVGDHWTFNIGLRLDDQTHWNDSDVEIFSFTDLAPRLTAVYDVTRRLQPAHDRRAGRYYDWIPMSLTEDFNQIPQGRKEFNRVLPGSRPPRTSTPSGARSRCGNAGDVNITPAYKDEFTLGVEWAFRRNWAFKANALYYEQKNQYDAGDPQVLEDGTEARRHVYRNNP